MANEQDLMEKIVALAKRRGFIYPSSEIYGGINGFWDYGPLGVELKRNVKDAWWHDMVHVPPVGPDGRPVEMVGLDCSIIMNPKVWEASGHVGGFADPMQTCRQCKRLFRADQVWDMLRESAWVRSLADVFSVSDWPGHLLFDSTKLLRWADKKGRKLAPGLAVVRNSTVTLSWLPEDLESNSEMSLNIIDLLRYLATEQKARTGLVTPCPDCGGDLTEVRQFNLMFKTHAGAMEDSASLTYLRPETAQGIFANYKNVLDTTRTRVPFGIAQIGKAFRNEINPRNFTFRSREFEQMEIEFFCHPKDADRWYAFWRDVRFQWYVAHGLKSSKLRLRDHEKDELAHYARACADVEYEFPFGTAELEGVANRTDFDLSQHQRFSGRDLTYFDDETKERFIPHVIEPSAGVDRTALAVLCEAYDEDEAPDETGAMQKRTVLRLHPRLAPVKVAVFPLVKKDGMPEKARQIWAECRRQFPAFYDEKGAVGRRYRRQDEAGTPFCITIDGQTREDGTVTVRDRDTMKQERIGAGDVVAYVRERLRI